MRVCILFIFMISGITFSQSESEMSPFATTGYGGVYFTNFNFEKRGMEFNGRPIGVELNMNGASFTWIRGQVRPIGSDSSVSNTNFDLAKIGYQVGHEFKLGIESHRSISIRPFVGVGMAAGSFPKIKIDSDLSSLGLFLAPGFTAKFSQLHFTVAYEGYAMLNISAMGDRKENFGKGFFGGLSYSLGISNSFDLLTPDVYSFRGLNVKVDVQEKSWDEYREKYGKYYKYRVTQTTTTTTKNPGMRTLTLVRPFFGVGPTYTMNYAHNRSAPTQMTGANFGLRFSYLMLDAFYEFGQYGLQDPSPWSETVQEYPIETNFDFSYQVPVTNYGFRAGFNLSKFITLNQNFEVHDNSKTAFWYVPFSRVNVFLHSGRMSIDKNPTYTYPIAKQRIDDFFSTGNGRMNEFQPTNLPEIANYFGWGASIEIGSLFVTMTKYKYKNTPVLNNTVYTVGANIPIGRIMGSQYARFKIRKDWKKLRKTK